MPEETKDQGFKITLSADDVRGAIQQALITALQPAERDRLVTEAIRKLLSGSYMQPSDLQGVFRGAAQEVAADLARVEFNKPENIEKLRAVVVEAFEKRFTGEGRDKLIENIGGAISKALTGDRY